MRTIKRQSIRMNIGKAKIIQSMHALQKKYMESTNTHHQTKAKNILHFNLGHVKLEEQRQKLKAKVSCEINTAFNQLIKRSHTLPL